MKDDTPIHFTANLHLWTYIADKVGGRVSRIIKPKVKLDNVHLKLFQSEMEEIMYWLQLKELYVIKEHFQKQIDLYHHYKVWV